MPLPDYEKFIDIFESNNESGHMEILHGVKHNAIIPFAMLVDKRTAVIAPSRDKEHTHPIAIDIFPTFPIDDDDGKAQEQINYLVNKIHKTHKCLNIARRNWIKYAYRLFLNGIVSEYLLKQINAKLHQYSWGETKRVRILSLGERELMALPFDCFDTAVYCEFHGKKFKIPASFHNLLSENYGNYMEEPPDHQKNHSLSMFCESNNRQCNSITRPIIRERQFSSDIRLEYGCIIY